MIEFAQYVAVYIENFSMVLCCISWLYSTMLPVLFGSCNVSLKNHTWTHACTCAHTHTHTHTHTCTHARMHVHTHTHTYTHTHPLPISLSHTHTQIHTMTLTDVRISLHIYTVENWLINDYDCKLKATSRCELHHILHHLSCSEASTSVYQPHS